MIRDCRPEDFPAISELHKEQEFDYAMPDLANPLFLVKKVREVDGRVVAACVLRITAETFLFCSGSPVEKGRSLLELQPEVLREAYEKGLSEIICAVPPPIAEEFGPVLQDSRLGWIRIPEWPVFQRNLG